MSRAALAHLAAAFGLGAGFAVGLAFAEVGWATLAFGAAIILAVLTTGLSVLLARRLDHRVAARLGAIGAAVGHEKMRRGHEVDYVEGIVSVLHQSLRRASSVRAGVAQSPLPMAVVDENGEIVTASAGLAALGPQFNKGATFPDYAQLTEAGEGTLQLGGTVYRVALAEEAGERRIVSLVADRMDVDAELFADLGEAMLSGSLDPALARRLKALGPEAEPIRRALAETGAGLALIDGVLAGERSAYAAVQGRNDALGARARQIADLIAAYAAAREEEDELRGRLEQKLQRIAELVDRHRAMAARLRDSAEEIRIDSESIGAVFDAGETHAGTARQAGAKARAAVGDAVTAARLNNEAAASLGMLTSEISSLVASIEEVSFRTNLIALNASVEAARAGEKGAGFAVVADEVRTLAQSASKTAKEIRVLVSRGREQSEDSVAGAAGLERLIEDLDGHLLNLSKETGKIADALSQGKDALAQIDRKAASIAEDADRATGGAHPRIAKSA